MPISFVDAAQSTGSTVAMPAHEVGDLIIAWTFRTGSNTAPSTPADQGWTVISAANATSAMNSAGYSIAYKFADTNVEAFGTWANATQCEVAVYRGVAEIGGFSTSTAISAVVNYPALAASVQDGSSWIAATVAHRTAVNASAPPSGMTNRILRGGAAQLAIHDTNGGLTSFPSTNVAVASSSGWRTFCLELIAIAEEVEAAFLLGAVSIRDRYVGPNIAARYVGASSEWPDA